MKSKLSILLNCAVLISTFVSITSGSATMYAMDEPHLFSLKLSYELCSYYSPSPLKCFADKFGRVDIDCTFSQLTPNPNDPSYITYLSLKFQNLALAETFLANDPYTTLPTSFMSGSSVVNDQNNKPWLTLTSLVSQSDFNSILIQDFSTNSTISIEQFIRPDFNWFNVYLTTDDGIASNGNGVLVTGCPTPVPPGRRRKRSVEECDSLEGSQYDVLSQSIVQRICEHDIAYVPDIADSLKHSVESMNTHQSYHESSFVRT